MKATLVIFAALFGLASATDYAVLVAGSKTFGNYRHQADVCHAYQTLTKVGGMDPANIIVMMADDVANDPRNPFPGKLYNKPTAAGTPGIDVYEGCVIDYKGQLATAANWMSVITGDAAAMAGKGTGRVLKSTSEDRVFLNFVDHGGVGLIAFPYGPYLHATDLNTALTKMYTSKMYSKLVFYMEACESGSMFETALPKGQNIYVTTAANAKESSWGAYCPPDDMINGKAVGSCLGDLYSINWMESADSTGMNQTLEEHYQTVKTATTRSHVMQYGDMTYTSEPIGNYMGAGSSKTMEASDASTAGLISSRDIPLHLAYYEYLRADKTDLQAMQQAGVALQTEIQGRLTADKLFSSLATRVADTDALLNKPEGEIVTQCTECCATAHLALQEQCGGYTDYSMQYSHVITNLCHSGNQSPEMTAKIVDTLASLC